MPSRRTSVPATAAVLAALGIAACETATLTPPAAPLEARSSGPAVYLVTLKPGVDVSQEAPALARAHGLTLRNVRKHAARGFSALIPEARVERLRRDPRIAIVERDGPVSVALPEPARVQAASVERRQQIPWGVQRVGGWRNGGGRTAWVIDSGIDLSHPDLNTSRACHRNFVPKGPNSPEDQHGHGTHVAGTIGARNNNRGVVGVAANATLCAVRVLDETNRGNWEWVLAGIDYVAASAAPGDVVNLSLLGRGAELTVEQAILDAAARGLIFVIAAGNAGEPAERFTPGRIDAPNVYTVSATDLQDCMPSWSNYGSPPVDFAAPGVGILSTWKGGGTAYMSGTSMATPHVSGILLLGAPRADGHACDDRDGIPDPIAHR